jgi:DNA-binding transcriptional MerR regulator
MALLPERIVAQRYGKHVRTLRRWDETPGLDFPKPIIIRRRRYRDSDAIAAWERAQAARSASKGAAS